MILTLFLKKAWFFPIIFLKEEKERKEENKRKRKKREK
jgi:hypothetical protein